MQRKSVPSAGLFLAAAVALAGCAGGVGPTEAPPRKNGVVRVACPGDAVRSAVRTYARAWESRTGGRVELLAYDPRKEEPPADATVWALPPATLPRYAAAGKLRQLPERFKTDEAYRWTGLLPLYREKLIVWAEKRYAVPLLGESPLCCYRSDRLADPKHQEAFAKKYGRKLQPPKTWEDYADVAEYFAGADGTPSLPPLPLDDDELERAFYTIAAGYARRAVSEGEAIPESVLPSLLFSFHYDMNTGGPRLTTPGFVYALKLMQRLQTYRPKEAAAAPAEAFHDGKAVLCLTDASRLLPFQKSAGLRDRFGICRMPGGGRYFEYASGEERPKPEGNRVPYLGAGGWLAAVPEGADDPDSAFDLLADLTSPGTSRQIVIDPHVGGGPIRQEHLDPATRWEAFELDPARTTALKDALRQTLEYPGLRNPVVRLRTPDEAPHRRALRAELRAALTGGKEASAALADAARRWSELDRARGPAAHLTEYRVSLGLLGR